MKLGMYIMEPESITTAYLINPVCVSPILARQRFSKNVTAATNTHNNGRIVGGVAFCAVRVV
jgi:hypothetical protein